MPRYLSPRKTAKYKELIEKIAKLLVSNTNTTFLVEGSPSALYDDLWTIRTNMFKEFSSRLRFKKQFNGVAVEVSPTFSFDGGLDLWDGESVDGELTRGAIGSRIILDKPNKIRFNRSSLLSESDIEKLAKLATGNDYTLLVSEKWLSFTKVNNESKKEEEV